MALGIPQKVVDKIFQPFFTTKPTGQGTGLGLSLSYDIIKAHGGEIKVETKEGEWAEFIVHLPLTQDDMEKIFINRAFTEYEIFLDCYSYISTVLAANKCATSL